MSGWFRTDRPKFYTNNIITNLDFQVNIFFLCLFSSFSCGIFEVLFAIFRRKIDIFGKYVFFVKNIIVKIHKRTGANCEKINIIFTSKACKTSLECYNTIIKTV